jgi:hypothetical protein
MTPTDAPEFFERLHALSELFEAKFTPTKAEIYFAALNDLPLATVALALNAAVQTCTFMPRPAELRTLALGDPEDQAEAAWMLLRDAMGRLGAYASLAITNAALGDAIVAVFGGWPQACQLDLSPEMWSSKRKEFGRVYRVLRDRQLPGARYLPGLCEQENAGRPEWLKYVTVGVLDGVAIRQLQGDEADTYRAQLAAERSGLTQIATSGLTAIRKFTEIA